MGDNMNLRDRAIQAMSDGRKAAVAREVVKRAGWLPMGEPGFDRELVELVGALDGLLRFLRDNADELQIQSGYGRGRVVLVRAETLELVRLLGGEQ